jgi:hypothetical protein
MAKDEPIYSEAACKILCLMRPKHQVHYTMSHLRVENEDESSLFLTWHFWG